MSSALEVEICQASNHNVLVAVISYSHITQLKELIYVGHCVYWCALQLLPSGMSAASEARPIIAFYSRFRDICIYIIIYTYIYIYIYICLSARALHKTVISQTVAQRKERLAVERLQHIPFFITYYTCTLPYGVVSCSIHTISMIIVIIKLGYVQYVIH